MNKYKKLLGNTMVFAMGQMGAKILSFLMIRLYTAVLAPDEYSTAELLYNTLNVLYPIVSFSMADAIVRFGIDKSYDIKKVYSSSNFMLLIGMLAFLLTIPLWNMISIYNGYMALLFVYCLFSSIRQLASQYARSAGFVKIFAVDGIISVMIQFLCNILFMMKLDLGINGYILSFVAADAFSILFLFVTTKSYKSLRVKYIDKSLLKEMLKYSVPLIPTYLLWWLTSSSDRIFVIQMVGEKENGIYAAAYRLPTLLMFVTTIFYQAWQISSIEEKDSDELGRFYGTVYKTYSSLIFIGAAFLIAFAKPLTGILLSGDNYDGAEKYTVILIVSMIFQCFCQFLSSIYSVQKKSKNSCFTAFSAALTNIVLNLLFIPKLGVYGAAIATAAAYFTCYVIRAIDTRRYIYFKINTALLAINTILVSGMCVLSVIDFEYGLAAQICIFVLITAINFKNAYAMVSKIVNVKAIGNRIKGKIKR